LIGFAQAHAAILSSASGATATPKGPVRVAWKLRGEILDVRIAVPKGVLAVFKWNRSHGGLAIRTEISVLPDHKKL
jgi:hypothetical protein